MPLFLSSTRTAGFLTPIRREYLTGRQTISRVRAAWLLDEPSGTSAADSTSNGFNSTSISGTTIIAGKYGNARSFGGSDSINLPTTPTILPQLTANDPFSISFWVNMTTWPTSGNNQVIARFGHSAGQVLVVAFNSSGTMLLYLCFRGNGQLGFTLPSFAGLVGLWTHVCMTFNGGGKSTSSTYTITVNNSALSFNTNLGTAGGSDTTCALGTNTGGTGGLVGAFDAFLVFDKVLTSTEIGLLANARTLDIDSGSNNALVT